jgi:hypothetical protein
MAFCEDEIALIYCMYIVLLGNNMMLVGWVANQ